MSYPDNYGKWYWCIRVSNDVSSDNEIYLFADTYRIESDGSIAFIKNSQNGKPENVLLIIPSTKWFFVYAASVIDGSAVAAEHWKGQIVEEYEELMPVKNNKIRNRNNGNGYHHSERLKMSQSLRYSIMERDGFTCQKCGRGNQDGVKLEVDHIHPVKEGGKTQYDNLQTLCHDCNSGKGDKPPKT